MEFKFLDDMLHFLNDAFRIFVVCVLIILGIPVARLAWRAGRLISGRRAGSRTSSPVDTWLIERSRNRRSTRAAGDRANVKNGTFGIKVCEVIPSGGTRRGLLTLAKVEFAVCVGGKRLFADEIDVGNLWYRIGISDIEAVEAGEGEGLLRPGRVILRLRRAHAESGGTIRLKCSRPDRDAFARAFTRFKQDMNESLSDRDIASDKREMLVLANFRSLPKVNLAEFSRLHRDGLWACLNLGSVPAPATFGDEDALKVLKILVLRFIKDGKLNGFLDQRTLEYTDKDMVVKQYRVVNVNVAMDFNELLSQLGNRGVILSSIQCTQCGAPCTPPPSGSTTVCVKCGAAITVTDVLERFKGLLS